MNRVLLVGNIAKGPDDRSTSSGISCCTFTVACNRKYANSQGVREADFINCVAWRQTADFIKKYFLTGNKIGVEGAIQVRQYEAQDGSRRYATEVLVEQAEFVAPKSNGQEYRAEQPPVQPAPPMKPEQQRMDTAQRLQNEGFVETDDDELPF